MRSVEASAKTRQEAIKKALEMLGVELHEVEIEILDEGSRGLFGLGARDVKVRVSAEGLPDEPKPRKYERQERPPREPREERRHEKHDRGGRQERPPKQDRPAARQERPPRPEKVQQQTPVRQKNVAQEKPAQERPQTRQEKPREQKVSEPVQPISDARREEAAALLGEVVAKMGIQASVTSLAIEDGGARINVDSPDSALLIGRKGKNLEALQYLINRMMTAGELSETGERFIVDVEHYLDRRRESLEDMARQLAQKAKETGRDVRVKPLSPQERRIIHMTLQDDPDVRTFSLGTATMRHVVISPKNAQREDGGSRRGRGGRGPRGRGGQQRRGSHRGGSGRGGGAPQQAAPQSQQEATDSTDQEH